MNPGFVFALLLLPSVFLSAGEWREKSASHRLRVRPELTGKPTYLDLRTLSLPVPADNGVRAFDETGKPLAVHRYDADHLLLAPIEKSQKIELYFGFPNQISESEWNKGIPIPPNYKLRQRNIVRRYAESVAEWEQLESVRRFSEFAGKRRELWKNTGELQAGFLQTTLNFYKTRKSAPIPPEQKILQKKQTALTKQTLESAAVEMEETMFRNFRNIHQGEDGSRIFFTRRPFDTDRNLITRFSGMLTIREKGDYEFKVNTNSTRIVKVDGETKIRRFGTFQAENSDSIGTSDYFTLKLDPGIHFLEFLYYKGPIATWAALSWRKKGETKYKLLGEDDFAPAAPVQILAMESRSGEKYPLILRNDSLALFTGKHNPYALDCLRVEPEKLPGAWELDGKKIDASVSWFALENPDKPVLKFIPAENSGYAPLTVSRKPRRGKKAPVRPDLNLRLWMPQFLYDDEYCDITLEINSGMPIDYTALLETTVNRMNPFAENTTEYIRIPSMPMEHEDRFACSRILKRSASFLAEQCTEPLVVEYAVSIPGLVFDRKKIRIVPMNALPEMLTVTPDGLADENGDRVMPLIHRTTLHEVRAWELPRKIGNELRKTAKLLVIGEEFGDFKEQMTNALKEKKIEPEFIFWNRTPGDFGNISVESIPEIIAKIRASDADAVLLIPLSAARRGTLGEREELNVLGFLLELLLKKEKIHRITLTSPLPLAPEQYPQYENAENRFIENLRKLRREKGVEFIELETALRKSKNWTGEAYRKNAVLDTRPVNQTAEAVSILLAP